MTKPPDHRPSPPVKPSSNKRPPDADRLAAALKENLHRRKAQARARKEPVPAQGRDPNQDPEEGGAA